MRNLNFINNRLFWHWFDTEFEVKRVFDWRKFLYWVIIFGSLLLFWVIVIFLILI